MTGTAKLMWAYVVDDRAATAVEYVLIASIISIAAVMVLTQIGITLNLMYGGPSKF